MEVDSERQRARVRVGVGAAVLLVLVGLGCAVLVTVLGDHGSTGEVARPTSVASPAPDSGVVSSSAVLFVHVLGAVQKPGLYELREGDRAVDAVAAAGGFTADADQSGLNLARRIVDGEQIVVPVVGQAPAVVSGTSGGKINLNTADAAALDTLPRVGPAMAERIIAWREANGSFTSVEDLLNVTGIGDKTFESLKDLVIV